MGAPVTPEVVRSLNRGINYDFQQAFVAAPSYWNRKARRIPSGTYENIYAWMLSLPEMRKWVGPRIVRSMEGKAYVLRNEPWELTIGVDSRHIFYDQLGLYKDRVRLAGEAAATWADRMVTEVQLANPICFDGQNFYDTDHPRGSTTYQNYYNNTPLTSDNLWAMAINMMSFRDDNGKSMRLKPTLLEVPPQLSKKAVDALKAAMLATPVKNVAGAENVGGVAMPNTFNQTFDVDLVINEELIDRADEWYLHSTNRMMPFLVQVAKDPAQMTALINASDPNVFFQREFIWGTDAEGAAGVTLPFLSIKCKEGA